MAGRKLGKLRQWATETILVKDKTTVTDEFRELEHDVELRREGIQRLAAASEAFHHDLTKKRESTAAAESEKLLAIDALGLVMIAHGEEFGEDSAYGGSLLRFGRAQCKIATLQETFGLTFRGSFLDAFGRYEGEFTEYQAQRKKLESRRLSYDAAMSKFEGLKKSKKVKEKELSEAEDEFERAKERYEETSSDVQARMYAIQENEMQQMRDLTTFLDLELNFYEQMVDVLKEAKEGWPDESTLSKVERPKLSGPTHSFSRTVDEMGVGTKSPGSKYNSVRSAKSSTSARPGKMRSRQSSRVPSDDEDRESDEGRTRPQRSAFGLGRRDSARQRANSAGTAGSANTEKEDRDTSPKKKSGWSMPWGNKGSAKSKDKFSSLQGDDTGGDSDEGEKWGRARSNSAMSNRSSRSKGGKSPKVTSRSLRGQADKEKQKTALALYDYVRTGEDEISFSQGAVITVLNELSDVWWHGELDGKKGLFPTSYVRVNTAAHTNEGRKPPMLPKRRSATGKDAEDDEVPSRFDTEAATDPEDYTDFEDPDHPFGDHMLVTHNTPVYGVFGMHSVENSAAEETEGEESSPLSRPAEPDWEVEPSRLRSGPSPKIPPKLPSRQPSQNSGILGKQKSSASLKKSPPPPPPPRRPSFVAPSMSSTSSLSVSGSAGSNPPPLPQRNTGTIGPSLSRTTVEKSPFDG